MHRSPRSQLCHYFLETNSIKNLKTFRVFGVQEIVTYLKNFAKMSALPLVEISREKENQ